MAKSSPISPNTTAEPTGFPQRWLICALAVAIALGVAAAISGELAGDVFRTFIYAIFLIPIVIPAWMLGILLTQPFAKRGCFDGSPWPAGFRSLVAEALGLGVLSIGTLALGAFHLLDSGGKIWIPALFPAAAFVVGLDPAWRFIRSADTAKLRHRAPRGNWVYLLAAVPAAILLIAATFPPGTLWQTEAHGYDVLEYHLELPREYALNNSTAPLAHNIYSYFPGNIEMLYLQLQQLADAALGGNRDSGYAWGAYPAQFLHVLLTLLTAAAIALVPLGSRNPRQPWLHATGRGIAVLFFLGVPWTIVTGSLAYNEMGMMFFGTLAIGLALAPHDATDAADAATAPRPMTVSRGVLIGLLLGLAVGCKMTAGVFFALPVAAVIAWRGFTDGAYWRTLAIATATATAVYAPWAFRAAAASGGNPLFPVATSELGRGPLSQELATRFEHGHSAPLQSTKVLDRLRERGAALTVNSIMDSQWSVQPFALFSLLDEHNPPPPSPWYRLNLLVLIVPLAIGCAFIVRAGRTETGLILAVLIVQLLAWTFATHLQARFLLPIAVPLALLAGRGTQGLHIAVEGQLVGGLRIATGTLVGLQALCTIFLLLPEAGVFGGAVQRDNKRANPPIGLLFENIWNVAEAVESSTATRAAASRQSAPVPPEPVLLLGDATAWRFEGPVSYFTVFDVNPVLDPLTHNQPAKAAAWLHDHGIKYVWVDWFELARLQDSYGLALDVPPPAEGDTLMTRASQIAKIYAPRLTDAGLTDTHAAENAAITIYRVPASTP